MQLEGQQKILFATAHRKPKLLLHFQGYFSKRISIFLGLKTLKILPDLLVFITFPRPSIKHQSITNATGRKTLQGRKILSK